MSTTHSSITKDMTTVEAANLLVQLEEGHEAAWLSTRDLSWQSPDYESRFQNAAEIDGVFRDLLLETIDNGMRHPGEPVEDFAERAESDAWLTGALEAGAETTTDPAIQQTDAGMAPERLGGNQDDIAARPLNDVKAPESQAYAGPFTAAAARELRERAPRPAPDRTPGAPHPDPVLASRGWHVNEHGIYTRRAEPGPQPQMRPGYELEAG